MSSDSECEEFYDAEESTPQPTDRHVVCIDSKISVLQAEKEFDFESQKEKLLQEKKEAEERLREEKEEIQRKLNEIQELERQAKEKKLREIELKNKQQKDEQESEKRAMENEQRKRKLNNMRQRILDDHTPGHTPQKPVDDNITQQSEALGDIIENVADDLLECHLPTENNTPAMICREQFKEDENIHKAICDNNVGKTPFETDVLKLNLREVDTEFDNHGNSTMNAEDSRSSSLYVNIESNNSLGNSFLKPQFVVTDCNEPAQKKELQLKTESCNDNFQEEPDLIKSTRPKVVITKAAAEYSFESSEGLMSSGEVQLPKVPPRKKRPRNLLLGQSHDLTSSPLNTPNNLTCGISISTPLSPSDCLNIQTATKGRCMVSTEALDGEALKGDSASIVSMDSLESKMDTSQFSEQSSQADPDEYLHFVTRPRSPSGRPLDDEEILRLFMIKNLDTGEAISLNKADEIAPKCIDPLTIQIMERTKDLASLIPSKMESSEDSSDKHKHSSSNKPVKFPKSAKKKTLRIKKFLGKTVNKIKTKADGVLRSVDTSSDEEESPVEGKKFLKHKSSSNHKGNQRFDQIKHIQDLSGQHTGAIWTLKFSHCGRLMASGGQDNVLKVWVLKEYYQYFDEMRVKLNEGRISPAPSHDSLSSMSSSEPLPPMHVPPPEVTSDDQDTESAEDNAPFVSSPFCTYRGHTAALLDISWSKNYFILTSSMDKTCRLWHTSRRECLCCFQHADFVTAICFHPKDDRYFLSGSLDGKLRLWNIPDKKVALWNEVTGSTKLITAANFCQNGKYAVVGTYDGRCIFYTTELLKYFTSINVRSTRGKNSRGRKISGIESMPGEDKVLVTSNDSRVRLYDLRDLTLTCKYKGCMNNSSQIKASFSPSGKYVICGSEDQFFYIWKTSHDFYKFSSARKDRSDYWEGIKAHNAVVTAAIFAPHSVAVIVNKEDPAAPPIGENLPRKASISSSSKNEYHGEVIITADFTGCIKVFSNPKRSKNASL